MTTILIFLSEVHSLIIGPVRPFVYYRDKAFIMVTQMKMSLFDFQLDKEGLHLELDLDLGEGQGLSSHLDHLVVVQDPFVSSIT